MNRIHAAVLGVLMSTVAVVAGARGGPAILAPMEARIAERQAWIDETDNAPERAALCLLVGRLDEASSLGAGLPSGSVADRVLAAKILLAVADYDAARPLIERLGKDAPDDPGVREVLYRWWVLVDDLGKVDRTSQERIAAGTAACVDRLAAADLSIRLLRFDEGKTRYQAALESATTRQDSAKAYDGLGVAANRLRDYDASLDDLTRAIALDDPDPDLLMDLSETLIRLGRTAEATAAAQLAVTISPFHERAHYLLGNGYAEKNYTELRAAHPEAFAGPALAAALGRGDSLLAAGNPRAAEALYRAAADSTPGCAEPPVRLGSLFFEEGRAVEAEAQFRRALGILPDYGRAHNGLAKSVEAKRLAVEVHRDEYEARFAALPVPDVPGIETFVVDWNSLSPRHRKQVALSIAPWKRYLPALIAGGSTFYIKPLYQLLSECPGQEILRDQRINYDSRLWDDVRGCGGYRTVTGIEDVERTIHDRYNTVLHELTHQVHAILPADRKREIQELYRRTKERDDHGGDAFLSRYAGGSVFEYFAEGANALESPRRDAYDTRDIVKERLDEKDPDLERLVVDLMKNGDVDSCYAPALAGKGDDRLERGEPAEALAAYRQALARSSDDESVLSSYVYALEVADSAGAALAAADAEGEKRPESASLAVRRAFARWESGGGLEAAAGFLAQARSAVRDEDRWQVDQALGQLRWTAGDTAGAREAYRSVLAYQSDNPEALWGLAETEALAGNFAAAWPRYEEAVRARTGVVDLRASYARDLLRAGLLDKAKEQIDAALLLDADDPTVLALDGWRLLAAGKAEEGTAQARRAIARAPWCDLATIVFARGCLAQGKRKDARAALAPLRARMADHAPPRYVYRAKWGRYDLVGALPAVERALVPAVK